MSIGGKITEYIQKAQTTSQLKWLWIILMILSGERIAATFVHSVCFTKETHVTTLKAMQAWLNLHQFLTATELYVKSMTTVR